jgi:hypothetical protein
MPGCVLEGVCHNLQIREAVRAVIGCAALPQADANSPTSSAGSAGSIKNCKENADDRTQRADAKQDDEKRFDDADNHQSNSSISIDLLILTVRRITHPTNASTTGNDKYLGHNYAPVDDF